MRTLRTPNEGAEVEWQHLEAGNLEANPTTISNNTTVSATANTNTREDVDAKLQNRRPGNASAGVNTTANINTKTRNYASANS